MLSYEVYKFLHIAFILLFLSSITIGLFRARNPTWNKIISGLSSLFIFVAGMGLMARLSIGHGSSWPLWIKIKMGLWLILAIGAPVLLKRAQRKKFLLFYTLFTLFLLAAYAAVYKLS